MSGECAGEENEEQFCARRTVPRTVTAEATRCLSVGCVLVWWWNNTRAVLATGFIMKNSNLSQRVARLGAGSLAPAEARWFGLAYSGCCGLACGQ